MTTINDDFNRADTDVFTGLGTATVATVSQGWSWTSVNGVQFINSNQAINSSGFCYSRAETDLASGDHYAQIKLKTTTNGVDFDFGDLVGVTARYASGANSGYIGYVRGTDNTANIAVLTAGTIGTPLMTSAPLTLAVNDVLRIEVSSNTISLKINGVDVVTPVTDNTYLSSVKRTGFWSRANTFTMFMDDFQAGDLAAGGSLFIDVAD